jgi:DNA-binding XRE family transcriptional regulator
MKKQTKIKISKEARETLYESLERGDLDLTDAVKLVRKIYGLSQVDFAKKVGVSKMSITNLESGTGNPTIKSVNKMLAPMDLELKIAKKDH